MSSFPTDECVTEQRPMILNMKNKPRDSFVSKLFSSIPTLSYYLEIGKTFRRKKKNEKCQTYLPVKYLIYSSVYQL